MTQLRLLRGMITHVGQSRQINEDYCGVGEPPTPQQAETKGHIYVVADGMGGHVGGQIASKTAVQQLIQAYYADPSTDVPASLRQAVESAHRTIQQQSNQDPSLTGMGTTVVAAVVRGQDLYVANVGDSRAYIIRGEQMVQLSRDHSWVADQVAAGVLTKEQARNHPQRNVITRSLGGDKPAQPDIRHHRLQAGDSILLCSDGIHGVVEEAAIRQVVITSPPQAGVERLVQLANAAGGPDNISAIVVRVAPTEQTRRQTPWLWIGAAAIAFLALLVVFILFLRFITERLGQGPETDGTPVAAATRAPPVTGYVGGTPGTTPGVVATSAPSTPTAQPPLPPGQPPLPAGAQPDKIAHRSDPLPGDVWATLHGIADYFGDPEPDDSFINEYEQEIFDDNKDCFRDDNPERLNPSCDMILQLYSYRLLLVGEVKKVEEGFAVLQVNEDEFRVRGQGLEVQPGDWVRVVGRPEEPYEGEKGRTIEDIHFLERRNSTAGGWELVIADELPSCREQERFWIYTQAEPSVWNLVDSVNAQGELRNEEGKHVLLRACRADAPGLRLTLDAVYVKEGDRYVRHWPEW